ncbi:hypothetical protein EVAR_102439_1 [Eumeta japonica]|uniref:Uncharacterized protein n=1 Tax=Eumeta variegata TaxID=151549 RepID=A0A4C1Z0Y1_EUMVA|nr:hypothetical protein EVAR_102439_1 [Eumeta japonica]
MPTLQDSFCDLYEKGFRKFQYVCVDGCVCGCGCGRVRACRVCVGVREEHYLSAPLMRHAKIPAGCAVCAGARAAINGVAGQRARRYTHTGQFSQLARRHYTAPRCVVRPGNTENVGRVENSRPPPPPSAAFSVSAVELTQYIVKGCRRWVGGGSGGGTTDARFRHVMDRSKNYLRRALSANWARLKITGLITSGGCYEKWHKFRSDSLRNVPRGASRRPGRTTFRSANSSRRRARRPEVGESALHPPCRTNQLRSADEVQVFETAQDCAGRGRPAAAPVTA